MLFTSLKRIEANPSITIKAEKNLAYISVFAKRF